MRISKMIEVLRHRLAKHGDLDVMSDRVTPGIDAACIHEDNSGSVYVDADGNYSYIDYYVDEDRNYCKDTFTVEKQQR